MKNLSAKRIAKISLVAALYFALTVAVAPLSFGAIQFRFSEILVLLCFFNKDYIISMTVGCFFANLFSPMASLDVPFGTLATLIAVVLLYRTRNIWISSLIPAIVNGIIVGIELTIAFKTPLLFNMATVALGELVVVTAIGVPIFLLFQKNNTLMSFIGITKKSLLSATE